VYTRRLTNVGYATLTIPKCLATGVQNKCQFGSVFADDVRAMFRLCILCTTQG